MKILIREGSAAKNYEALKDIISLYPDNVMFCTDDSHPGDLLVSGHIDKIVKRAVADGIDIFTVFKVACINPIRHYHLDVGMLQVGDPADFIVLKDLKDFGIESVYINGEEKYNSEFFEIENSNFSVSGYKSLNQFNCRKIEISQISKSVDNGVICIQTFENELITKKVFFSFPFPLLNLESDIDRDILKIVYVNRYHNSLPQIAYITGIGLKRGAFASSISHDSHNIIAVGCNDKDIARAINNIIENKGGLTVVDGDEILTLPLPIGGIMTVRTGEYVAEIWEQLIEKLKTMGCILNSPFMTLSFMSLIVIPELKIGEKGLFEFSIFDFISNE